MSDFLSIFSIGLFQNTLRTATPVVLAALGLLLASRSFRRLKELHL